jgi:hypothetical protein
LKTLVTWLVKKFSTKYGTQRSIIMFTSRPLYPVSKESSCLDPPPLCKHQYHVLKFSKTISEDLMNIFVDFVAYTRCHYTVHLGKIFATFSMLGPHSPLFIDLWDAGNEKNLSCLFIINATNLLLQTGSHYSVVIINELSH